MKKEYKRDELTIIWDPLICIHSGLCMGGLPEVFKPKEKPWILINNETKEKIKQQVLKCPSGALSLKG